MRINVVEEPIIDLKVFSTKLANFRFLQLNLINLNKKMSQTNITWSLPGIADNCQSQMKGNTMTYLCSLVGNAFLRIPAFYQALSLCVRTIEYSDPSLLINIDPNLVTDRAPLSENAEEFF